MASGHYSAAVRCLELQGKYLKMFSDKIEHVQTIEEFSTDELVEGRALISFVGLGANPLLVRQRIDVRQLRIIAGSVAIDVEVVADPLSLLVEDSERLLKMPRWRRAFRHGRL